MIGSSSFGPALFAQFLEGGAGGDFEGQDRRVDVVEGAVDQRGLEVDQRKASQQAVFLGRFQALDDAGMYSFGTAPPTMADSNTKPRAGLAGLEDQLDAGELTLPPVCFLWV